MNGLWRLRFINRLHLNNSVMQRLPVFYPGLDTQTAIIETFTTIDQKLSAAVRSQTALQDLFRTLLHQLMTAKTRVHDIEILSFNPVEDR